MKRVLAAVARACAALLIGAFGAWALATALVIHAGARATLHTADAILVLGAAQYNGRPSPVLQARVDHAVQLYRDGLAGTIIFTGGVGTGDTVSEAEVARRYAVRQGVPAADIMIERFGVTSAQSVGAAAALMAEQELETALLVSDSYHMMRLDVLARRAGIRPFRAPAPNAPIDRATRQTRWRYLLRESVLFPATAILGAR